MQIKSNYIEIRQAAETGTLPISRHTAYKWHSMQRYPRLIVKVAGKLFFDQGEWQRMCQDAADAQAKKAHRLSA